ncbi:hypothetical protein [Lignipirellula cremea]|uniref:Uncharacterized protein n=1 Tax=Lignipirellula cremea TaxID=2528010 RepID=A0A518DWU1_9BACT|nr:hypothetical protein [Lignipirellula cremea]QDU96300.1 hypothetical protein Pla8534_41200 [Lignipirellula cremea]
MNSPRKSIVNSPWYWVYLFATAGIVALTLMGPKFSARQSQIERNYQGRMRANQRALGEEPRGELSTPENTIITLWPLYVVLIVVIAGAWVLLWRTHFRRAPGEPSNSPEADFPQKNTSNQKSDADARPAHASLPEEAPGR